MSQPVLVGYCPQTGDRSPVAFAVAVSRLTGAPLVIVSVYAGGAVIDRLSGEEFAEQLSGDAANVLERVRAELGVAGADLRLVEEGSAARGLALAIEQTGPALVVLGSTARGPVGRVLPGSTAERVIHGAPCPVAVVPRGYEVPVDGFRTVGGAFVPAPEGREALRAAALIAHAAGARVRAIMALDPELAEHQSTGLMALHHRDRSPREESVGRLRLEAEQGLKDAIAELAAGTDVEPDILFQDPADGLAAASGHLDLLVMGSRAYGPLRAVMLGGVSRQVVTRATCPVLVLPRGTEGMVDALLTEAGTARAG
jgi:nucleotide-binding universal stress UspA family protein